MASVDYKALAPQIIEKVGGEANINSMTHCATRLRFKLKDENVADKAAVEKLPGVITVMKAGGQFQVVIGNNVPTLYAEITKITKLGEAPESAAEGPKGNLLNQFIELISSIFLPVLWPLAGTGLLKALLALCTTFSLLDPKSTTYTILNASADALFTFLPMFLAVTAAKRFRANPFTTMAIAGALVYPSIVKLAEATDPVTFFGLPVVMMSYTSSVIPIIIAAWLQGYLERFLNKILPDWLRNFMTPLLTVLIMVPFVLMTVGPLTTIAARGISSGVNALFHVAPWLAGAIMGGLWQVFVLFGLHWGFVPIMMNDLSTQGFTLLGGPLPAAVLAQAAAAAAVAIRTKSAKRREIATAGTLSGFVAGVTEPVIYGVNLPLKKPFYFGIAGGALGGAIAAAGGNANDQFVFPSILGLAGYMKVGNFTMQLIGCAAAIAVAFTLTFLFAPREAADTEAGAALESTDADAAPVATGTTVTVQAPVAGRVLPLTEVPDKVFASQAMGSGVGVIPSDGRIVAPVDGTVVVAMKTRHAYGLKTADGVEVLVHIGIDTVNLNGDGFVSHVAKGDEVKAGQLLAEVDLEKVRRAGYDPTTILVITNTAKLGQVAVTDAETTAAGDPVVTVTL